MLLFLSLIGVLTLVGGGNMKAMEQATFGMGCFWCSEAMFSQLRGVQSVRSGFSGGTTVNPSYREVCTGETGHAEVVHIVYAPAIITYTELLKVFFTMHDPTTLNQQGPDIGTQYRSVIFFHSDAQRDEARRTIEALTEEHVYERPIVTQVVPFEAFYPAEDYHTQYFSLNKNEGYCRMVVAPKVEKFEKIFHQLLQK